MIKGFHLSSYQCVESMFIGSFNDANMRVRERRSSLLFSLSFFLSFSLLFFFSLSLAPVSFSSLNEKIADLCDSGGEVVTLSGHRRHCLWESNSLEWRRYSFQNSRGHSEFTMVKKKGASILLTNNEISHLIQPSTPIYFASALLD
jgi:hypothetical protein